MDTTMIKLWIAKGIKMFLFVLLAGLALGAAVMYLWNWLIPAIFTNGPEISFIQALGVLALSKILFGGFRKGGHCGHCHNHKGMHWRQKMEDKIANMTPEEKEKFKQKFGNKCRSWMGKDEEC